MIQSLKALYTPNQLIINEHTYLRDFYDIIEMGSYYADNIIIFVMKIPIMHTEEYSYYQLFPTLTLNDTIIIPPKPFLAMNENMYQYMKYECKKFKDTRD